jgi:hypothetical protein
MVEIAEVYGRRVAHEMIQRSREDYRQKYADFEQLLDAALDRMAPNDRQPSAATERA